MRTVARCSARRLAPLSSASGHCYVLPFSPEDVRAHGPTSRGRRQEEPNRTPRHATPNHNTVPDFWYRAPRCAQATSDFGLACSALTKHALASVSSPALCNLELWGYKTATMPPAPWELTQGQLHSHPELSRWSPLWTYRRHSDECGNRWSPSANGGSTSHATEHFLRRSLWSSPHHPLIL